MAFRMRWALYAVLAVIPVIAALVGGMMASAKPVVYTAEARLAVGRADLIDAGAQAQAANFARFLDSATVLRQLPAGKVLGVSASPIPESNVIRVEGRATDSATAVAAAKIAARGLQVRVANLAGQSKVQETLAKLKLLNRQVATFQSAVNAAGGTGSDYVQAATQLASAQVQQQATSAVYQDQAKSALNSTLSLVAPAAPSGDNASSQKQIYMLAGLGGGGLVAYVIARILADQLPDRRGSRQELQASRDSEPRAPKAPRARDPQPVAESPESASAAEYTASLGFAADQVFPQEPRPRRVELPNDDTRTLLAPAPSQGATTNARRGLNGLRQDTPAPRRTWS